MLYERLLDVAPRAPAIRADVRASGGRLRVAAQQQKGLDLIRNCVRSSLPALGRKEVEEEPLQCQRKDKEVNERTAELHSKDGNTDTTELVVIDETTQCETCKTPNAKGKSLLHM